MKWTLAGLGNPDTQYQGSRHNVGRDLLHALQAKLPNKPKILVPDTYMNDSGKAFKKEIKSKKAAETLAVLHDDLDLPLGKVKVSFGSGAGGHRGVASVQAALKTKDFVRIRIGISPATPSGKIKKPDSGDVVPFVLGKFKPAEQEKLKKVKKTVGEALELILIDGKDAAMNVINIRQ